VFETGVRQFRMAMAMVSGRRISPRLVERLIADANATMAEFGTPGDDVRQLLEGPFADPDERAHFQTQALRRTARRLAAQSPFYAALFEKSGIDARKIELAGLAGIRPTAKADLAARPRDFICADSPPHLSTRTTGTTGKPAEIWMSVYESRLWPAMAALSGLLRNEICPTDCLQINLSSRATAAVLHDIEVCRLVGARSRALGLIPVGQSLDSLLDDAGGGAPTILGTYPSYLAQLVTLARRRGLGPADFALRRADVAGELLSAPLSQAVAATFGCEVTDSFAMTEVLRFPGAYASGGICIPT
jgi:phenylacetate-coenzyme A ligase PaaK-like adenylate-forming protein